MGYKIHEDGRAQTGKFRQGRYGPRQSNSPHLCQVSNYVNLQWTVMAEGNKMPHSPNTETIQTQHQRQPGGLPQSHVHQKTLVSLDWKLLELSMEKAGHTGSRWTKRHWGLGPPAAQRKASSTTRASVSRVHMHPRLWEPEEADVLSQLVLFLPSHFPTINPHFKFHCLGWIKKFDLAFLVV